MYNTTMDKKIQLFTQNDSEAAAAEAGEHLNLLLTEHKKTPVLLLVSGGSALAILNYVGSTALGENLSVCVLDERFSQDPAVNNFAQMQKLDFYQLALDAGASFFGTLPRNGESMKELAKRWETNLENWKTENPDGIIIATLGMGADGHTAGIFPEKDAEKFQKLFYSSNWITAYTASGKMINPQRLTATATFLQNINFGLIYVCGADKKPKLDEVINHQNKENLLPALLWHKIKDARIFTDIK